MGNRIGLLRTYVRLGLRNLLVVLVYRLALRLHLFPWIMRPAAYSGSTGPLFRDRLPRLKSWLASSLLYRQADDLLAGRVRCFSAHEQEYGLPPDWFLNPFTGKRIAAANEHWSCLNEFDTTAGDIKCIWEISRFDWVLVLSRAYCCSGDCNYLLTLNGWYEDWCTNNPLYIGPNWKCGQEAAIRMMQVLLASFLVGQHGRPTDSLVVFVKQHAQRISPTLRYGIAQDNNHGTSEAAALFVAGAWLLSLDSELVDSGQALTWQNLGRKWLENRVGSLVENDGSFSQYSLNYHRVVVDTLWFVEFWRDLLKQPRFSTTWYRKAEAAVDWLYIFTDEKSGDAPNMGANDGARLFNLSTADYRDYRPSVQVASRILIGRYAYPPGSYDEPLRWLGFDEPGEEAAVEYPHKTPCLFSDGGYCFLCHGETRVFVRYPVFTFRPGHADALHLDLWYGGLNIVRDAGTFSYNAATRWLDYFPGTAAHSTAEFDGRDQMVRVSRFLFGDWLSVNHQGEIRSSGDAVSWSVGYRDAVGASHRRVLRVSAHKVIVRDQLAGFKEKAVLRWRLLPREWELTGSKCFSDVAVLSMVSTSPSLRIYMEKGYESRYYLHRSSLPVLCVEVLEDCEVVTEIDLNLN